MVREQANLVGGALQATVKDAMLQEFGHFDPALVRAISYVTMPVYKCWVKHLADMPCRDSSHIKCWPLYVHEPLPTLSDGRIVLIGDAGHPVYQHLILQ